MRREDATLRAQEQPARPGRVGPSGRVARAPSRCIRTGSPSGVHGARGAARIRPTSSRSTTRPSARGAGCRLTSRLPIAPLPAAKASTCGSRPRRTCAGASREVSLVRAWIHGSDNGSSVNRIGDKAILGVDPRESWPLLVNGVADYRTQYGPMHTFGVAVPVQMAVVQPIAVDCESQLQGCLLTGTSAGMVTFMGTVQSSFPGGATVGAPPPPTWCCANPSMRTSTRVTRSPSS